MSALIPPLTRYRVAAIQFEPALGEKEKNTGALLGLIEEAASHDARLIVLPEMATTGYCWLSRKEITPHVEPIPGPTTSRSQRNHSICRADSWPHHQPFSRTGNALWLLHYCDAARG